MALLSSEEINNIRASANIVSIIGSYLPLTQRGKNYLCVCPFHDDHSPSMSVSEEKQIYKCFSCGATGNVFTFVSEYENIPFIEAVAKVASKCGKTLSENLYRNNVNEKFVEEFEIMTLTNKFFQNNLKTDRGIEALNYLKSRGLTEETIKEFGIGLSLDSSESLLTLLTNKKYDSKKLVELGLINNVNGKLYDMFSRRIVFPLWDKDGNIVGFSARIYRGEKDVSKYMNSRESKIFKKGETLYNYHKAKDEAKKEKAIIVVEGFMDAIRVANIGLKNVVALQGTAMTENQISLLKKLRVKVILCLDNDNAGLLATVNNGDELVKHGVETYVIRLSEQKDPDEYILANGKEAFLNNYENPLTFFEFKMSYLKQNKNLDKVEDLTAYINDVLKSLAESSDEILRELTLNKLSKDFDLSIDILKNKLMDFSPKEVKKEINVKEKEVSKKDGYLIAIEKILYFMMNGEQYIREYQKKIGFFREAEYREIANEIVYFYEEYKKISIADFITYINDNKELNDKVMQIVNESLNDQVSLEAMEDYIKAVIKNMTKNEIKRLKGLLKSELDIHKKMKIAEQIMELKKEDV